ncbi:glycosyltransferase [Actinacidiphila acididurans]|uniref:glycosyltransferase n=1 Tax=Actinacidiphila acididurans TaxID=2784346 RepID=UPI0027DE6812|nr:glycosyltransferase [Actinacidiphila acididurans]
MSRDIFIVSNSVDELGGVTTWSHQMARLFTERGHRVHMIGITPSTVSHRSAGELPYETTTLYDTHPPQAWSPKTLGDLANMSARMRQARRRAGMREQAAKLTALFRAARPGGVLIVTQVWAMEWVNLADTGDLTVIGMSHESFAAARASSRFARVKRHYKDVDRFLTLTREDADLWARQGMNNVGFMPNALPWVPGTTSPRSEKAVATVARLSQEKGIDMLLDAWAVAVAEHPGWTLRIYGAGEDEQVLKQQAARLELDGSVEWMGRTDDVPGALRSASVFALPSRAEGFPLTLLEAMVSALPCVAFDVAPGVREIIADEEDGFLAAPGNIWAFAEKLGILMGDAHLRDTMGERAAVAIQRYTTEKIVARWEELFDFLEL